MNMFTKLVPNVWGMKTDQEYQRHDTTTITTKRGKEIEVTIYNLFKKDKDGNNYYSIVRNDGMDNATKAQQRADNRRSWAESRDKKATEYYEKANLHSDFLSLGEPIKVGHHSESRHRKIIDQRWNNMGKSVENSDKADEHNRIAEYWDRKAKNIDLSTPQSLEYYTQCLVKAKENQKLLKENPELREHSYSLAYATKRVNLIIKNLDIAIKLWGGQ